MQESPVYSNNRLLPKYTKSFLQYEMHDFRKSLSTQNG